MSFTDKTKPAYPDNAKNHDALAKYYKDVEATSLLTAEAERVLIVEYHANKSPKARDKIIQGALRYVIAEARKHPRALQDKSVLEDLIAAGNIGLIRALGKFDPDAGTRFLTYAGWWVRHEMREESRRIGMFHIPAHAMAKGVRAPTPVELSEQVLTDLVAADNSAELAFQQTLDALLSFDILSVREIFIIKACYGIHTQPKTLKQIGKVLDITGERVRQLRESALHRLRATAATHGLTF
jgi:RNA polymerase sigma factor (sigma-70 family)